MRNFGALFLGEKTCVSYGDKVIGTNHVLPTLGAARYTGGPWVGKYLKTVTYQEICNRTAARSSEVCGRAARVELFEGHARSGDVRAWRHGGDRFDWIDAATSRRRPAPGEPPGRPRRVVTGGGTGLGAAISLAVCTREGPGGRGGSSVEPAPRRLADDWVGIRAEVCDVADPACVADLPAD